MEERRLPSSVAGPRERAPLARAISAWVGLWRMVGGSVGGMGRLRRGNAGHMMPDHRNIIK